jgi:5,5'-dehydrodivanillate O-demethylase
MLTQEENQTLTRVGPGTPMGGLLRRYWHPIAAVKELDEQPTRAIRLLGEDLVLYKDTSGVFGLLDRICAHRLGDLSQGTVEENGLRCANHGWLYDETGQCLEQPLEEHSFADKVKIKAYDVEKKGGLLWAYTGPLPRPLVPDWEPFSWTDGLVQIVFSMLQCNWLQCQENSVDPDSDWLQKAMSLSGDDAGLPPSETLDIEFDEFDYGFVYRHAEKGAGAGWEVGRTSIWPNGVFVGGERSCHFEWYVPVDDLHTVCVSWFFDRFGEGVSLPEDDRIVHWYSPSVDEDGDYITSHALNRKFALWLTQGIVFDRTNEHLAGMDKGLVLLRNKLFSQIDLIADGGEPKAVLRDPSANRRLPLPFTGDVSLDVLPIKAKEKTDGEPAAEGAFPYLAGQPEAVEAIYKKVIASWGDTA